MGVPKTLLISQTIPGILQSSYQHDPVGNITDWQDLLSTGQDQLFDYDALYRLINASGAYGDFTYTYDATGNRLSLTLDGSTETYSYVPSSHRLQQILGSVTDDRTYDAAGNTIQSLIGSYTYDDTNRMVSFTKTGTTATYAYNGKGERISKNVDGTITRFRYAPAGQLLGEYDQNGQAIREYITLEGQPVALVSTDPVTAANIIYYLHTDHLGAVVKATDGTQALVWDVERKPFGERSVTTAQIEMPLGFPGQYFDEESGNYYNYFRDYDPSTGRYLQSDPIGLAGGINTYAYVRGNPLFWVDRYGLAEVIIWAPVGQGSSSFGHTSSVVNGTSYSWGPSGMDVRPAQSYIDMNTDFRPGMGFDMGFTPQEDDQYEQCLENYEDKYGDYDFPDNNCTHPIQNCLSGMGMPLEGVFGNNTITPAGMGFSIGVSRPGNPITPYPRNR
ncbi:MAG: RHS repeat-associated core domain-containing protein [Candidatus Thiodiazotropha sp.]